jgi:hypothetical protein
MLSPRDTDAAAAPDDDASRHQRTTLLAVRSNDRVKASEVRRRP